MANAMRLRPAGKKASQAASQPANGSNGAHCQQPNANPDSDADADSMLMQTHSQPASQRQQWSNRRISDSQRRE